MPPLSFFLSVMFGGCLFNRMPDGRAGHQREVFAPMAGSGGRTETFQLVLDDLREWE